MLVDIYGQEHQLASWSQLDDRHNDLATTNRPTPNNVLPFPRASIALSSDDLPRQHRTFNIEDGQIVFIHLLFRMNRHHVVAGPDLLAKLLEDAAGHVGILQSLPRITKRQPWGPSFRVRVPSSGQTPRITRGRRTAGA